MTSPVKEHRTALLKIPINDCGETLVPIPIIEGRLFLDESETNRQWLTYRPDFRLRLSVKERLVIAAKELPEGTAFLVKEALRPSAVQKIFWDNYLAKLQSQFPSWNSQELEDKAWEFVAPPELAVHPTGAAVDLTLCDSNGSELDLGTAYDADPVSSDNACYTAAKNISSAARRNRGIMGAALANAGFYNFPYEWWHWSYGDREWAEAFGRPFAIYGTVA